MWIAPFVLDKPGGGKKVLKDEKSAPVSIETASDMKSLVLTLTVILSCTALGSSQQQWYKDEITVRVLPPYIRAYNSLQNEVLAELLKVDVAALDDDAVGRVVNRLYCSVQKVYQSLQQSVAASETLQANVGARLSTTVAQVGAQEQRIRDKDVEIAHTNQILASTQNQLVAAQQAVREKERAVADANQAVRDAEEDVERARKCRGKRGWFSKITSPITRPIENAIKDIIIKPVCSVINMGGIDNAKGRRDTAYNQLASARNQEQYYRQVVAEQQAMKNSLEAELNNLRSSLATIRAALRVLQDELTLTSDINTQVKHNFELSESHFSRSLIAL